MKKLVIVVLGLAALAGVAVYSGVFTREPAQAAQGQNAQADAGGGPQGGGGFGPGGFGGGAFGGGRGGRGRGPTGPMTVEVALVSRGTVAQQLTGVGNLVGDATVAVVPRAAGRLQEIYVRLGDRITKGQRIAKIEDLELQEQVKQSEAALEVSRATIRQREADLNLAQTNVERSRNLFARQLLPKQTLDDSEARYQAAVAQLDLARAQNTQSTARLEELRINLANTNIMSPVNGFVARRAVDPGAFVGQNAPVVDVVDIGRVRLVVNVIEKDLKQIQAGDETRVEVDAYPGEVFTGRIARVAPVLDPATRTAPIEIEIPNPAFRLKPGMYARISITTDQRKETLVVPANAVVDLGGRRGVLLANADSTVTFRSVRVGIEERTQIEILDGVNEGERIVTVGAAALQDGARVIVAEKDGPSGPVAGAPAAGPAAAGDAPASAAATGGASATPQVDGRRGRQGGEAAGGQPGTGRRGRRGGAAGNQQNQQSGQQP
ncbi:MAG: efflux RND transporter periplasmic adaptor subunit [Acidobacteria bacterium]|nr:efflux RND transporter periplasmic adaptor subunit [Acidobacteriota bacterium]